MTNMPVEGITTETPKIAHLDEKQEMDMLRRTLQMVAPGTELRKALERIQRSQTGGLVVLGYTPRVEEICSGGFELDTKFSAASLRELCKMDGAVVVDTTNWRIRRANVRLLSHSSIPTTESGTRHRAAQRAARQTGLPVLSISASMRLISIYVGTLHRTIEEPEKLLSRTNQAVDTLERYIVRLNEVTNTLSVLELTGRVTVRDVVTVIQRMEMIRRIHLEISEYLEELGNDGRLLSLQVDELLGGSASERSLVLRDYIANTTKVTEAEAALAAISTENTTDLTPIANAMGLKITSPGDLERPIQSRGMRVLSSISRLKWDSIVAICTRWDTLDEIQQRGIDDLQTIEGIGPYLAQIIVDYLQNQIEMAEAALKNW